MESLQSIVEYALRMNYWWPGLATDIASLRKNQNSSSSSSSSSLSMHEGKQLASTANALQPMTVVQPSDSSINPQTLQSKTEQPLPLNVPLPSLDTDFIRQASQNNNNSSSSSSNQSHHHHHHYHRPRSGSSSSTPSSSSSSMRFRPSHSTSQQSRRNWHPAKTHRPIVSSSSPSAHQYVHRREQQSQSKSTVQCSCGQQHTLVVSAHGNASYTDLQPQLAISNFDATLYPSWGMIPAEWYFNNHHYYTNGTEHGVLYAQQNQPPTPVSPMFYGYPQQPLDPNRDDHVPRSTSSTPSITKVTVSTEEESMNRSPSSSSSSTPNHRSLSPSPPPLPPTMTRTTTTTTSGSAFIRVSPVNETTMSKAQTNDIQDTNRSGQEHASESTTNESQFFKPPGCGICSCCQSWIQSYSSSVSAVAPPPLSLPARIEPLKSSSSSQSNNEAVVVNVVEPPSSLSSQIAAPPSSKEFNQETHAQINS